MPHALVAYDGNGEIVHVLDFLVVKNPDTGRTLATPDLGAIEEGGGKMRYFANISNAVGSGTWPEFLGHHFHDFRVELQGKRIVRLVHHRSQYVRHRDHVEAALETRRQQALTRVRKDAKLRPEFDLELDKVAFDVTDLIGAPGFPLDLDENGRTRPKGNPKR